MKNFHEKIRKIHTFIKENYPNYYLYINLKDFLLYFPCFSNEFDATERFSVDGPLEEEGSRV
jgi:hypothetical protein